VTVISHEIAEIFSDPFPDEFPNFTPWWLATNGNCQDQLEVGDVTEEVPGFVYTTKIDGFTYHMHNVALLPWFASESPSSAIDGAYSYPDTGFLQAPPTLQRQFCQ